MTQVNFRPIWISWCNQGSANHILKCSRRPNSQFQSLERIFYSDSCHWICSIVIKKSTGRSTISLLACHWNNGSYKFLLLEKFLCVQSNRFLITSFTKWTHNRPHSNIAEDHELSRKCCHGKQIACSQVYILLMMAAFWTHFFFES